MLHANGKRRYLPPPPLSNSVHNLSTSRDDLQSAYSRAESRRLDDMHDWAIYRTNVNSKYATGALHKAKSMPFGDFYLDKSTVDALQYDARHSNFALDRDPNMYIEFGLPRLSSSNAQERMSKAYSAVNIPTEGLHRGEGRRYGHSVIDVRTPDIDFSAPYQRSKSHDVISEEKETASEHRYLLPHNGDVRHEERGIENLAYSREDMRDRQMSNGNWESSWDHVDGITADRRRYNDDLVSAVNPHLKPGEGYYKMSGSTLALAAGDHPSNYRRPPTESERFVYEQQKSKEYATREWKGYYSSMDELRASPYPHVQVRALTYERKQSNGCCGKKKRRPRILENINFEVHGGEVLAILGHSGAGKTALLDVLANRTRSRFVTGNVVVNGNVGQPSCLSKRVAYVRQESHLVPYLSVHETVKFFLLFKKPEDSWSMSKRSMIEQLIDDIRLAHVKDTRVSDLATGEKKRLTVACQVALNTDIILLDEPTTDMETYPSMFLMEYLRGLAAREKIIMLTLHHPNMEIFSMLDKVVLLSAGRMMYYGSARGMISYFSTISYSYPPLVNPCDYYVDLVTLDDRSIETIAESSDRINRISSLYQERALPLSEPEPSAVTLRKVKHSGACMQFFILLWRMFTCHNCTLKDTWLHVLDIFLAALMSVLIGVIFSARPTVAPLYTHDRFGFMFTMLVIAPLPFAYRLIGRLTIERREFYAEVEEGLYSPVAFFFAKIFSDLPLTLLASVAYISPAYWIAEMKKSHMVFGIYLGIMLLYIYGIRLMAIAFSNTFRMEGKAARASYAVIAFFGASSGFVVHPRILYDAVVLFWTMYVSNSQWAYRELTLGQMTNYSYEECVEVAPTTRPTLIISEAPLRECQLVTGMDEMHLYGIKQDNVDSWVSLVVIAAFALFFFVFAFIAIGIFRLKPRKSRKVRLDPVNRPSSDYRSVFTL